MLSLLVAPHTRCVDWNDNFNIWCYFTIVAPHTRCVDWNSLPESYVAGRKCRTSHEVRGLKYLVYKNSNTWLKSHLTRGAWIEIDPEGCYRPSNEVAPHTRCVDWNISRLCSIDFIMFSFIIASIFYRFIIFQNTGVAPHTRCVDWNNKNYIDVLYQWGRTSHEVRGLK